jgi:hypothetical protein
MGAWGAGNFDNDGARDYLHEVVAFLLDKINYALQDDLIEPDELGESELVPSVDLLALLCEQRHARPPEPNVVKEWKERYLACWDTDDIDEWVTEDFKLERRKIIEETFNRLLRIAET